jgi:hypothetical protein
LTLSDAVDIALAGPENLSAGEWDATMKMGKGIILLLAAAAVAIPGTVFAQAEGFSAPAPKYPRADPKTAYPELAQLPDWTGVWAPDWAFLFRAGGPPQPKLTPAAAERLKGWQAAQEKGENLQGQIANCLPPGMPGIMRMPYPIEFVYAPNGVYIITETFSQVRRIYTDGRPLPEDPDPFFNGHSIGRWEGDTLVVETIGLNPKLEIQGGIPVTDKTRIVERIRMDQPGRIMIDTTVTDPDTFIEPFTTQQAYVLRPDWEIREYICQENNRDAADEFGRPTMNID